MKYVDLRWEHITYTLNPGKKQQKVVLDDISGELPGGCLLAILGPSGSGKTSLLNVLAGRVPLSKGATLTGTVTADGKPRGAVPSAYVMQDEALFELATVRETLMFTAQLRLPHGSSMVVMEDRVGEVMSELNISKCADTIIGNQKVRGLSGGERKRVNIGVELLNNPPLVFMDEPTSGLDSFQAAAVMSTLSNLARAGRTIVASIHQPRSSIYAMLDQMLLMACGQLAYFGPAGAQSEAHFASIGLPTPSAFNPADHFIDVVSLDGRDEASAALTEQRVQMILQAWRDRMSDGMSDGVRDDLSKPPPHTTAPTGDKAQGKAEGMAEGSGSQSPWTQAQRSATAFRLLAQRTLRENTRDKAALAFKYIMNIFFAGLFGFVYFQMDRSQTSIQNRTGVLFFTAMNQAFGSTIGTADIIPKQLLIVSRERASKMYGVGAFYLATWVVTLPLEFFPQILLATIQYFLMGLRAGYQHYLVFAGILVLESQCAIAMGMLISAMITNVDAAPKVAPAVVVLFLMFSGYFLNDESIPVWLSWLKYLSFIRYAFQALVVNEFRGATFDCDAATATAMNNAPAVGNSSASPSSFCLDGDQVLRNLKFDDVSVGSNAGFMFALIVGFNAIAFWAVLVLRKPSFVRMGLVPKTSIAKVHKPAEELAQVTATPVTATVFGPPAPPIV